MNLYLRNPLKKGSWILEDIHQIQIVEVNHNTIHEYHLKLKN